MERRRHHRDDPHITTDHEPMGTDVPAWWPDWAKAGMPTDSLGLGTISRKAESLNTLSGVDEVDRPRYQEHVAGAAGADAAPVRARITPAPEPGEGHVSDAGNSEADGR